MAQMLEAAELIAIAAFIAAFGVATLVFRVQREIEMAKQGERTWIPWADMMMFAATLIALAAVVLLLFEGKNTLERMLATCACLASTILVFGYIPAILAHYRLILSRNDAPAERDNPEPAEQFFVLLFVVLALVAVVSFIANPPAVSTATTLIPTLATSAASSAPTWTLVSLKTLGGNRHSRTTRSPRGSPRSVPSRRYPATARWPRALLAIGGVRDLEGMGCALLRNVYCDVIADEGQDLSHG